jgi:D-cysteine desulfhydrase
MSKMLVSIICFLIFPVYSFAWPFEEVNSWISPYAERNISVHDNSVPHIFKALPLLRSKIPYMPLGEFPTPVRKLESLGKELGVDNLYFKDDGASAPFFGGNKIRKLEFLLADAIYIGGAGSNCVLATLAQAKRVGFDDVYCLLCPQLNTSYLRRNLLLNLFYGGIIKYYKTGAKQKAAIWEYSSKLQREKTPPYIVGWGGTCPVGFLGYMNAAFELKEQISQGLLVEPDYIYVPLGSCGTAGGLILGAKPAGLKSKIVPVAISGKNGSAYYRTERLAMKLNEAIDFFVSLDPTFPSKKYLPSDIEHKNNFSDYDYAEVREEVAAKLKKLFECEQIKLEGTYTGKALVAMMSDLECRKELKDKNILFWNTFCYGTFEDVTNKVSYKNLPAELHRYFEEDIQAFDGGL